MLSRSMAVVGYELQPKQHTRKTKTTKTTKVAASCGQLIERTEAQRKTFADKRSKVGEVTPSTSGDSTDCNKILAYSDVGGFGLGGWMDSFISVEVAQ